MSANKSLPPIAFYKTRSFWLSVLAGASVLASVFGVPELSAAADAAQGVADGHISPDDVAALVGAGLGLLAYGQRMAPNFRIALRG